MKVFPSQVFDGPLGKGQVALGGPVDLVDPLDLTGSLGPEDRVGGAGRIEA